MSATGSLEQVKGMSRVLVDIVAERHRQDAKWGRQDHPDGTGPNEYWLGGLGISHDLDAQELARLLRRRCQQRFAEGKGTWADISLEEFAEALAEDGPVKLRAELIQKAAVAVAWVEAIDRRLTAQ